jgi:hypothetical protein
MYDLLADCAAARLGCVSFDPTEAIIAISARNEERRLAIVMPKSEGTRCAIRFVELPRDPRRARTFPTRGLAES